MPRQPNRPPIQAEFFVWRLFRRDGVYYVDGRSTRDSLGKHSLGTRDADQAMENLRLLDRRLAIQRGLVKPDTMNDPPSAPSLDKGWDLFLDYCSWPEVMGGASATTIKRYQPVRAKFTKYCERQGLRTWSQVDNKVADKYGRWLAAEEYADRTAYLELTVIKLVHSWLIDEGLLPGTRPLVLHSANRAAATRTVTRGRKCGAWLSIEGRRRGSSGSLTSSLPWQLPDSASVSWLRCVGPTLTRALPRCG
jgi:hypothetical protein